MPAGDDHRGTVRSWLAAHRWIVPLLAATAAFHAVFVWRTSLVIDHHRTFVLFDDAMISMRYARNLVHGHGLVWNPGGARVEGITNPAWTLWMAALHLLPLPDRLQSLPVMVSSSLLVLATVVNVVRLTELLAPKHRRARVIAGVAVATYYPYTYWSLRGMEVGLLGFLSVTAVLLVVRDPSLGRSGTRRWLPALLALMVLTRLDAVVLAVLVAAGAMVMAVGRRRFVLVRLGGSVVATVAAITVFRIAYYGGPLPNTYYLKATGVSVGARVDRGRFFLQRIALVNLGPYLVFALGALLAMVRRRNRHLVLVVATVLSQAAYSVWAGGDAWEEFEFANRYLSTVAPLLMVAVGVGLVEWSTARERPGLLRMAGLSFVSGLFLLVLANAGEAKHVSLLRFPITAPGLHGIQHWRHPLELAAAALAVGGAALAVTNRTASAEARWRERLGRQGPSLATGLLLVGILGANQLAWRSWLVHNAPDADLDKNWAREGYRYRRATDPTAVIAVFAAGSVAYFSERPAIDVLGKSDKHIAQMPPATKVFRPGHNKYDLEYSINHLRPDLVEGASFSLNPEFLRNASHWGYHLAARGELVRNDSRRVNETKLAAADDASLRTHLAAP